MRARAGTAIALAFAGVIAAVAIACSSSSSGDASDAGKKSDAPPSTNPTPNCPFDPPPAELPHCDALEGTTCTYGSPCVEWICTSGSWCTRNVCDGSAPGNACVGDGGGE